MPHKHPRNLAGVGLEGLGCAGGARPKSCRGGGKPAVGAVRGLWGPCGTWEGRELIAQHGNCPHCCRTDKHQRYWLQEPFGSPNISLISSFILHHFFKQPQWKGLCILHENPKYCEELTSSPGFHSVTFTSLSHTFLSTLLGEKKDDLLPWHSRGCFPHTQKYFHECIMICTYTACSIYKYVEHQANFQFLASRGTFWVCVGESHGIFLAIYS